MDESLVALALLIQYAGLYAVWANRWNIPTHFQFGFSITAFVIPALFTDSVRQASPDAVDLYVLINVIGGLFFLVGLLCSRFARRPLQIFDRQIARYLATTPTQALERRVFWLAAFAVLGFLYSYSRMGFVPMFADNPFAAKQFKGEYQEAYHRAAWVFRFSFAVAVAVVPVALAVWWRSRRPIYLALSVSLVLLLISTLARASALNGVILFLGAVCAYHRRFNGLFFLGVVGLFGVGSAAYYIMGILFDIPLITARYDGLSIAEVLATGAPDIADHLMLLESFLNRPEYTLGRTFLGGLVPFNFKWNPSVWTLMVANPSADDISDVVSGGLRLPVSLWGYVSFGWIGCAALPLLSGLILGMAGRAVRHHIETLGIVHAVVLLVVFNTLMTQAANFYFVSIHNLPSIAVALYLCFGLPNVTMRRAAG